MPCYDCTYVLTNPELTQPEGDPLFLDGDVDYLATRVGNHMFAKANEGWRLVSTATPPGANAVLLFWEQIGDH
jgi:hypothetical protein